MSAFDIDFGIDFGEDFASANGKPKAQIGALAWTIKTGMISLCLTTAVVVGGDAQRDSVFSYFRAPASPSVRQPVMSKAMHRQAAAIRRASPVLSSEDDGDADPDYGF